MFKNFFITIISVIVSFIVLEVFIRNTYITNTTSTDYYTDIGRGFRKNLDFMFLNEGFSIGKFNNHRFVGEDRPYEKSQNVIRIALLGDSYIEALQVFERDHFGKMTEEKLSELFPQKKIEVLNFGRSSFGFTDFYSYHKRFVNRFEPDFYFYFISKEDLESGTPPPYSLKTHLNDGELTISLDYSESDLKSYKLLKKITKNSTIAQMLVDCRFKSTQVPFWSIILDKFYITTTELKEENIVSNEKFGPSYYYENVDPIILKILDDLNPNNVIFINRGDEKLPLEFKVKCIEHGFSIIDLSSTLEKMKSEGIEPKYWEVTNKFGHWNHATHKRIGEQIIELCDSLFVNNQRLISCAF